MWSGNIVDFPPVAEYLRALHEAVKTNQAVCESSQSMVLGTE
jgi:hypothetical protein